MNILFLDDDKTRYRQFKHWKFHDTVYWAQTAQECIHFLSSSFPRPKSGEPADTDFIIDELWLDHDLGDRTFVSEDDTNTGSEVVRWLVNQSFYAPKIKKIYIHSLNESAARSMGKLLAARGFKAYIYPFTKVPKHPLSKSY